MAAPGAPSHFPLCSLSPTSQPLSVITLWPLIIVIRPRSRPRWGASPASQVPAQSDHLHAGCSTPVGTSSNTLYFIVPLDSLMSHRRGQQEIDKGCIFAQGTSMRGSTPSPSRQPPAQRARSSTFHSHFLGRVPPGWAHQRGQPWKGVSFSLTPLGEQTDGKILKGPNGQADGQERQPRGKVWKHEWL